MGFFFLWMHITQKATYRQKKAREEDRKNKLSFKPQPLRWPRSALKAFLISFNLLMTPQLTSHDYGRSHMDGHSTYLLYKVTHSDVKY